MQENLKTKTVRLRPEVIEKVKGLAVKNNRSFANMIDTILDNYKEEM